MVCQGFPPPSYCDCNDCSSFPELCACDEAQACCANAHNLYESYYFEDDLGPPYDIDACPGGRGQATAPRCLGCVSRSEAQRDCAGMCAGYYHYQLHNHDIDMCNEFCDGEPICRCLCKESGPIELLETNNGSLVPDGDAVVRRSTLGVQQHRIHGNERHGRDDLMEPEHVDVTERREEGDDNHCDGQCVGRRRRNLISTQAPTGTSP